jgi:hypothetical protein
VLRDDKDHFQPYEEVNGTDTSETDRPKFKVVKAPTRTKKAKRAVDTETCRPYQVQILKRNSIDILLKNIKESVTV